MGSSGSRQQEERALSPFGLQDGVEPWIPPDSRLSGSIDDYDFDSPATTHNTEPIPKSKPQRNSSNRSDPGYHTDVMSSDSTGKDKKKQVINITIDMNKMNRRFSTDSEPEVNVVMKSGGGRSQEQHVSRTNRKNSDRPQSGRPSTVMGERPDSKFDSPRYETPSPVFGSQNEQILPTEVTADEWSGNGRLNSSHRRSTGIRHYSEDDAYSSLHEHGFTEEEHAAATKIQAHFRGFLARKRIKKENPKSVQPKKTKRKPKNIIHTGSDDTQFSAPSLTAHSDEIVDVNNSAHGTSRSLEQGKNGGKNDRVVRRTRSDTNLQEKNRGNSKSRSKSKPKPFAATERSSGVGSKNSKSSSSTLPPKSNSRLTRVVAPKGKEGTVPRSPFKIVAVPDAGHKRDYLDDSNY